MTRWTRAEDGCGHGTHIASTIASAGPSWSSPAKGIAPGVRLIALRVLDGDCTGRTSDVINALMFAAANKETLGIDVINLSLGHPVYESVATDPLVRALEQAVRAGIVIVVSAGNHGVDPATDIPGYGGIPSPANAPSAVTVGATNTAGTVERSDDIVARYSSRGPTWIDGFAKPDVVAPGHRIVAPIGTDSMLYDQNPAWRITGFRARRSPERHEHGRGCDQRCRRAARRSGSRRPQGAHNAQPVRVQGHPRIHGNAGSPMLTR